MFILLHETKNDEFEKMNHINNTSPFEKSPAHDTYEISIGYVNDAHGETNNMMRILSGLEGDLVFILPDDCFMSVDNIK